MSTAKYEPLELSPPSPGMQRSSSASNGHKGGNSTSSSSSTTQRKAILVGLVGAICLYSILTLLGGSSRKERDHFLQTQITYPSQANDHYKRPGTLQLDRNDYRPAWRRARWIPLDRLEELTSTGRNGLERDWHIGDGFDLLESIHAALKKKESSPSSDVDEQWNTQQQFDYLRNKTILVLGDGVDRQSLDYACEHLLQGRKEIRRYTEKPIDLSQTSDNDWRDPHVCMLPEFLLQGTTIWSFMTYSILASEDTFARVIPEVEPRRYIPRLKQIAQALQQANVVPDMVLVHSTLWDLDAINFDDALINMPPSEMLTVARLVTYHQKLREALLQIEAHFPRAKKLYRTLQTTKVDRGDWWMPKMPDGTQPFPRVPYSMNKGQQLNTVTSQVLAELGWPKFDFHHVLSGYIEDYEGSVHVGNIGKTMWTQMMLYYLQATDTWL